MQGELEASQPSLAIHLIGINEAGQESGNEDVFASVQLPLLQDDTSTNVWGCWQATWRDVRILDQANQLVGVYNLTEHDLSDPDNYAELEGMLIAAAGSGG